MNNKKSIFDYDYKEIKNGVLEKSNQIKTLTKSSYNNAKTYVKDNKIFYTGLGIFIMNILIVVFFLNQRFQVKLGKYSSYYSRSIILLTVFIYIISLLAFNKYINPNNNSNIIVKIQILFVLVITFTIFLFLFKHFIFSFTGLISVITLLLIVSTLLYLYTNKENTISRLIILFFYTIDCYKNDFLEWINKEYNLGFNNKTYLLITLICLILTLSFIIPIIISLLNNKKGIILIKEQDSLENDVLYLNQDDLNDKIIKSKSFYVKKLLELNNDFKTYLGSSEDSSGNNFKSFVSDEYDISNNYINISNSYIDFPSNSSEGFDSNIHKLDTNLLFESEYKKLSDKEKEILDKTMKCSLTEDDLKDSEKLNNYIFDLNTEGIYSKLLEQISDYNKTKSNKNKNNLINQNSSYLVNMINRIFNIKNYNYHYGISFWVYFDPSILEKHLDKKGIIFNYSNCPKIYYDYYDSSLYITVTNYKISENIEDLMQKNDKKRKELTNKDDYLYKTKNILFQRWNNFVINYNYGALDIFINNNLVLTKKNISPYIKNSFLQLGSSKDPLINSGICNAIYHEYPLNKNEINTIYKDKNSPCY